jgi:uncharacterized protein
MDVSENVHIVRRVYELWNAGEIDGVLASMDPEIEYVNPDYAVEPGTRRGLSELRGALVGGLDAAFSSYEHDVRELIAVGDEQVLVLLTFRACGLDSGAQIEVAEQHLVKLRDGKVARIEWFHDEAAARSAAGVA